MNYYFVIVAGGDVPVYELDAFKPELAAKLDEHRNARQFALHSALDLLDHHQKTANTFYLRAIDRFQDTFPISAHVTATGTRLLLLHDPLKSDDAVRAFLADVHESYLKAALNPFYERRSSLRDATGFEAKVRAAAKKYLEK